MLKRIGILLLTFAYTFIFIGCSTNEKKRYEAEFLQLFDTVTQIIGYAQTEEEFEEYSQLIYDQLKTYHELYDIYNNYDGINNIKTINDQAGIAPVKVDKKIIDLLLFSKEMYDKSNGMTNIALGAVLKIWHDYREAGIDDPQNATLPPIEQLEAAALHSDINKVIIDVDASTVYLADPQMRLDVGAIAKGYATEQVSQYTYEAGYTSGLISVGGNVRAVGSKNESEEKWIVDIKNPDIDAKDSSLITLELEDLSLVTSGDYQRYYFVEGERYHHLIDPNTLMPANYYSSVSIVCKDSGMADALSTAIFNMPFEEGKELIDSIPNTEALWVFVDGRLKYSDEFEKFIKEN